MLSVTAATTTTIITVVNVPPPGVQVLLKAIAPYTRVRLPYLASELNGIPVSDVEDLLVSLILDGKVDGKIDQVWCGVIVLPIGAEFGKRW